MRKTIRLAFLLAMCGMISGGCASRIIKEGYYGATGSSGHYILLTGDEHRCKTLPFSHGGVKIGPIQNAVGRACPPEFIQQLHDGITHELITGQNDEDQEPLLHGPANQTLLITGNIIHYDEGKLLDKIVGPLEEAICRLEIRDAQTQTLYAEANFVSRAKSSIRKGPKELAQGIGKAIKKLLAPKDQDK